MLTTAGCDEDDYIVENITEKNEDTIVITLDTVPQVLLKYVFLCDSDLVAFVTPEVIYTDSLGTHNVVLDENKLTSTTYAYCYTKENGMTVYTAFEVEEDGKVPEPWIIESYFTKFSWEQDVNLNRVDVVNDCIVKFHRKSNYVIDADKLYRLSYNLSCPSGSSRVVVDGRVISGTYTGISIGSNGKTSWYGYELESFLDELCAKEVFVSMKIDRDGTISKVSK